MDKGWFIIPGVQDGNRTVEEQLKGLEPMLAEVSGKSVLDLGCAEGAISHVCIARGAARVYGLDCNAALIHQAARLYGHHYGIRFAISDLNEGPDEDDLACCASDIVLALAVFHKLREPEASVRAWAALALSLLVVRLPLGSTGEFGWKHGQDRRVDLHRVLPELGFVLERTENGPRNERVQYWRRVS